LRLLPKARLPTAGGGPASLLPTTPAAFPPFTDFDEGIAGADVVMMLRIQRERMETAEFDSVRISTPATASPASG
jgi:aspartate carbamoyltransferase catalytic subunit